jgi:hypothetical protein
MITYDVKRLISFSLLRFFLSSLIFWHVVPQSIVRTISAYRKRSSQDKRIFWDIKKRNALTEEEEEDRH